MLLQNNRRTGPVGYFRTHFGTEKVFVRIFGNSYLESPSGKKILVNPMIDTIQPEVYLNKDF